MKKSPEAFRTISEAAEILELPAHVLRFWESKFPQLKPIKRAGGRRFYRPNDIVILFGIRELLHSKSMTIVGVKRLIKENGIRYLSSIGISAKSQGLNSVGEESKIDQMICLLKKVRLHSTDIEKNKFVEIKESLSAISYKMKERIGSC